MDHNSHINNIQKGIVVYLQIIINCYLKFGLKQYKIINLFNIMLNI
jgi:hypothetical protein